MATVNIMYPTGPAFNLQYYYDVHMPLIEEVWKPFGLQGYEIVVFEPDMPYQIQAILKWDSLSSWEKASTDPHASAAAFGDIPKFTDAKPVVIKGLSGLKKSMM